MGVCEGYDQQRRAYCSCMDWFHWSALTVLKPPLCFHVACIALVEEINWQTGITDPKKKIQIGSFQLDARGNINAHEVTNYLHMQAYMNNCIASQIHRAACTSLVLRSNNKRLCSRDSRSLFMSDSDSLSYRWRYRCFSAELSVPKIGQIGRAHVWTPVTR